MSMVALWSMKAGVGVSTLAALLAASRRDGPGVLLVDLAGDQPVLLALTDPPTIGLADWLQATPDDPVEALRRLEVEVAPDFALLPLGTPPLPTDGDVESALSAWRNDDRLVIVDCGCLDTASDSAATIALGADVKWLVTRLCYLSVHSARHSPIEADGVVILNEPGRVLTAATVATALGIDVALEVAVDPLVARLVDTGSLVQRIPRSLCRAANASLRDVA